MLILPTDSHWKDGPPASVAAFRDFVADHLEGWDVQLTAYDNDAPEGPEDVSAAVRARVGDLHVSISRHAGSDTVLVQLGVSPPVPFEDLAVQMDAVATADLIARVRPPDDPDGIDLQPLVATDEALAMLNGWWRDRRLSTDSCTTEFWASLGDIAAKVHKSAGLVE